jgi:hypothetical protein
MAFSPSPRVLGFVHSEPSSRQGKATINIKIFATIAGFHNAIHLSSQLLTLASELAIRLCSKRQCWLVPEVDRHVRVDKIIPNLEINKGGVTLLPHLSLNGWNRWRCTMAYELHRMDGMSSNSKRPVLYGMEDRVRTPR